MITISICPDTGLTRKVTKKDLYVLESAKQVILKCHVSYYDESDEVIERKGIQSYIVDLVASDSLVNPTNGQLLNSEQLEDQEALGFFPISEFEYFMILKNTLVKVNEVENAYIAQRDAEGKFNV